MADAKPVVKRNALGLVIGRAKASVLDDNDYIQVKTEFDPETGSTKPVEEALDFQKLIESYKDQCGVEFMLKQVKMGAITLESLADDGKHGADISDIPEGVNEAYQAAVSGTGAVNGLEETLGIKLAGLTQEDAEKAIAGRLAEIYKAAQPKTTDTEVKE